MDEVRLIHSNSRNVDRRRYWQVVPHKQWEPAFIRTLPAARQGRKIPFVVQPALGMWSEILGFQIGDYYTDPLTYLTAQLQMKVYHWLHFDDDTYIDKSFRILVGTVLEGSLLGVPCDFSEGRQPSVDYSSPLIDSPADLGALELPDFHTSGIMPWIHRSYAEMRDALDDDFLVMFPDWIMGPFGLGCQVRGFENFLLDLVLEPEFARDVLRFIVEARKAWQEDCDRFLGIDRTRGLLGNDDLYCPIISPALYEEMVLPLELELCERYSGIFYWHSCGDTTKLLELIAHIPVLDLYHCGPWTDVARACHVMGGRGVPIEICIEPVDKVQMATPAEQRRYLENVVAQIPADVDCYVKVDSLEVIRDLPTELEAIQSWIATAREVLG